MIMIVNFDDRFAFVTHEDLRGMKGMDDQTIIAIKAPSGTRLEVPDPDEVSYIYISLPRYLYLSTPT